mmetsp:Transcript_116974/g.376256  ORF Transcript_116974/g.376256 Transcript_116974/m.376256 type:complete len:440 (+) Transcript_116974:55-1374(+)
MTSLLSSQKGSSDIQLGSRVQVWSSSGSCWVDARIIGFIGTGPEDRVVVKYDVPGVGLCEKKMRPDSKHLVRLPDTDASSVSCDPEIAGRQPRALSDDQVLKEEDPKSYLVSVDLTQRLEEKFGIGDDVGDTVRDCLADMQIEACSVFLNDELDPAAPSDPEALAWTFAQCNHVMNSTRPMPFKEVFPHLVKRMLDIGHLTEFAAMFEHRNLPDLVRESMNDSQVVCIGVLASEGSRAWAQLYSHERRIVSQLVHEECEIASARQARELLTKTRASFTALGIMHDSMPGGDSVFEVPREAETECLSKLQKQDKSAAKEALTILLKIHRSFDDDDKINEMTRLIEPMLNKDVLEALIISSGIDFKLVCEFLISIVSGLRLSNHRPSGHIADVSFLLLKRVFDMSLYDVEAHQHIGLETALLLLDPTKELAIRRWATDPNN